MCALVALGRISAAWHQADLGLEHIITGCDPIDL